MIEQMPLFLVNKVENGQLKSTTRIEVENYLLGAPLLQATVLAVVEVASRIEAICL
jgi:hypothetical protein